MTVVVQTPFNSHVGNGVTTVFGFTFQLLAEGDLQVSLDGVVQVSGYTVSGLGVQAGGDVTFSVAPGSAVVVDIRRAIPLARSTDYQTNGDLPSDEIDRDLDRLWQAQQDLQFNAGLSVQVPVGDTAAPVTIPAVSERAGKFLAFDGSGNPIAAEALDGSVVVSAFMETVLDDANASDARDTLELGTVAIEDVVPIAKGGTGEDTAAEAFNALKQAASTTATGVVELATAGEAPVRTNTAVVLTPATLRDALVAQNDAPIYAVRAWANVDGATGSVRAGGNISVVRNAAGDYSVTFTTAMPSANYSVSVSASPRFSSAFGLSPALFTINSTGAEEAPTSGGFRMAFRDSTNTGYDPKYISIQVVC